MRGGPPAVVGRAADDDDYDRRRVRDDRWLVGGVLDVNVGGRGGGSSSRGLLSAAERGG